MCGIAGTYHWPDGGPLTQRLTAAVEHRGPDGSGHYGHAAGEGEVHLGHRRLSIVDLTETGAQPMVVDVPDLLSFALTFRRPAWEVSTQLKIKTKCDHGYAF